MHDRGHGLVVAGPALDGPRPAALGAGVLPASSLAGVVVGPAATTTIGSGSPRIHTRAIVTTASTGWSRPRKRTLTRRRRPVRTAAASCDRTAARVARSQKAVNCLPDTYPDDVPSSAAACRFTRRTLAVRSSRNSGTGAS